MAFATSLPQQPRFSLRGLPATVYLITDNAAEDSDTPLTRKWIAEDDHLYLSWAEARILNSEQGIEFGSHPCSHSRLLTLPTEERERELLESYNDLVTHLQSEVASLSYPKGEYSESLAVTAQKVYACAVTTDQGANELDHDLFTLGRALIGDFDDEAAFAVRVSGLRWWLANARTLFDGRAFPRQRAAEPPYPEVKQISGICSPQP